VEVFDNKKKRGRPPKKDYDEAKQFNKLLEEVDYCYDNTGEIKATAVELGMNPIRVKKLLITSGKLEYEETGQIQRLLAYGKSMIEIQSEMNLKKSSINSYLPYSKLPYKEDEISANADRCDLYRKRKAAVETITDRESLWECIVLFGNYLFETAAGKKFRYHCDSDAKQIAVEESGLTIPFDAIADTYEGNSSISAKEEDGFEISDIIEAIVKRLGHRDGGNGS